MTANLRYSLSDWLLLSAVLALAAGTRIGYLMSCADGGQTPGLVRVQDEPPAHAHADLVRNLIDYRWFGSRPPLAAAEEQTAHASPGWPWLWSWLGRLPASVGPTDRLVRWLQAGLGIATVGLLYTFARRAFRGRRVAGLAGGLAAVYPFWVANTADLGDGVLATFLLVSTLALAARASQEGGPLTCLLLGLSLAALALLRAALLPFALVALLWFLRRSRTGPAGWLGAVLGSLGFLIGLAPWTLRNYQVFHDLVPIVDSTYFHLWMGNNPHATGGPLDEAALQEATDTTDIGRVNQPERFRALGRAYWREVGRDPTGFLRRRVMAGLYFLFGQSWFTHQELGQPAGSGPAWLMQTYPALLIGALGGLFALAFWGWRWSFRWRGPAQLAVLAVLLVPLPYVLGHAEDLSGPRLPLDAVLLVYASFALACLVPPLGRPLAGGGEVSV